MISGRANVLSTVPASSLGTMLSRGSEVDSKPTEPFGGSRDEAALIIRLFPPHQRLHDFVRMVSARGAAPHFGPRSIFGVCWCICADKNGGFRASGEGLQGFPSLRARTLPANSARRLVDPLVPWMTVAVGDVGGTASG